MDENNTEAGRGKFVRYRYSRRYARIFRAGRSEMGSPLDLEDLLLQVATILPGDIARSRRLVDTLGELDIPCIYARVGFLVPTCYYAHLRTRTVTPTLTRERCH